MKAMTEKGDWTLESYEFEDIEVTAPAPDVAIIAYTVRQNVTMGGKKQELRAADTSLGFEEPKAGNVMRTAKRS